MTTPVYTAHLPGRCVAGAETDVTAVETDVTGGEIGVVAVEMTETLRYSAARPFEVAMTFGTAAAAGADVTWAVSRELLVEGVTGSAGVLDILLHTYALRGEDVTVITLQPPRVEPAHIVVATFSLSEFLAATEEVVPPGTESAIVQADPLGALAWELNGGEQGSGDQSDGVGS